MICGGMRYGLYDIERSKRKMGRDPSMDKLLLRSGSHPRCYESGNNLADTQKCGKAGGWPDEAREGAKET